MTLVNHYWTGHPCIIPLNPVGISGTTPSAQSSPDPTRDTISNNPLACGPRITNSIGLGNGGYPILVNYYMNQDQTHILVQQPMSKQIN